MAASDDGTIKSKFSPSDIDRILTNTFIQAVDYYETLPSTNTRAMQLAVEQPNEDASPVLVIADTQTAGRGRGVNRWWSSPGSLTFSVLLRSKTLQMPLTRWPQLSLATGLAICDALEPLVGGLMPLLKWPNDVLVDGRKICGILAEVTDWEPGNLIVGIGVNVNNRSATAPTELRETVVALADRSSRDFDLVDVLIAILRQLEVRVRWLRTDPDALRDEWSRRCLLTGKTVEIEVHRRRTVGSCEGIDPDGALILRTPSGPQRFLSGTIVSYG